MPEPAQILGTPPLRKKWQDARKLSDDAAVKSKEDKKLAELHKNKMKGALGPDLESWPKNYPREAARQIAARREFPHKALLLAFLLS